MATRCPVPSASWFTRGTTTKVSSLLAAAGAVLALSAGGALAAEARECCRDMAADAKMSCCDKVKADDPAPQSAPAPSSSADGAAATVPT